MTTRCTIVLISAVVLASSVHAGSHQAVPYRSTQELQVVSHQFPHLLINAFNALNPDNEKEEREQAFYQVINNIANIASLIKSSNEISHQEVNALLQFIDMMDLDEIATETEDELRTKEALFLYEVGEQFPHLLINSFVALNQENNTKERYQAFYNALNSIVNIASHIRSVNDLTSQEIDEILHTVDQLFDESTIDEDNEPLENTKVTLDTEYTFTDDNTKRNSHIIAHNFPHLMLNAFIAFNSDNDRTERHLALYNALNNIVNIATVIRSSSDMDENNIYHIIGLLDTALGEDNIELKI